MHVCVFLLTRDTAQQVVLAGLLVLNAPHAAGLHGDRRGRTKVCQLVRDSRGTKETAPIQDLSLEVRGHGCGSEQPVHGGGAAAKLVELRTGGEVAGGRLGHLRV